MNLEFALLSNDSKKYEPKFKRKKLNAEFISDALEQFKVESGFLEVLYLNDIDGYNRVEVGYLTPPDKQTIVYRVDWES